MLDTPDGAHIACRHVRGAAPGVLFCGGFRSDMTGTKAVTLEDWATTRGAAFTRFDYHGHGASDGAFSDGTIGRWLEDALLVLDRVTEGPVVVVGSSMGAWIATLLALARPARVAGLVLIAPALDFTETLIWERLPDEDRAILMRDGVWLRRSDYSDEPDEITWRLIEEGRDHLLLDAPIAFPRPVRILQGTADETVPWRHAVRTMEALDSSDVTLTLVKNGDHRLSDPANLERILQATDEVVRLVAHSSPRSPSR
ncbi:MAG TPA: alpha/beta hydrolase [Alphaproteobacteria bacterium]|nr:alpha/beta hydrolase [Alphaproteobacteria bacterium]